MVAYLDRNQQVEVLDGNIPYWSHIQFHTQDDQVHEGYILTFFTRAPTKDDMIRNGIISFEDAFMDNTQAS